MLEVLFDLFKQYEIKFHPGDGITLVLESDGGGRIYNWCLETELYFNSVQDGIDKLCTALNIKLDSYSGVHCSWGFWDETATTLFGGYTTKEEAIAEMQAYAKWLETGEADGQL